MTPYRIWGRLLVLTIAVAALGGACSMADLVGQATQGSVGGLEGNGGFFTTFASGGRQPLRCDSSCVDAGGKCLDATCVLTDNPGNINASTIARLEAGGAADPSFRFLYPYDQTVFPRGLLPPKLQFDGTAPDVAYVHVSFPGLEYKGFYGASNPGSLVLAPSIWKALTVAATGRADVKVEVTKMSGGQVSGPIAETWTIATGTLRGTIYYETYGSLLLGGVDSVGIMKIQPGAAAPTPLKSGCGNVCHTASADGSTLVAAQSLYTSASYDLRNNAALIRAEPTDKFTYGALYPDGSMLISATNYRGSLGNPSRLYDTKTGANIPALGWDGAVLSAGTPAFSPDGKKLAFNREDTDPGHTLAVADFDFSQKTFSNIVSIATNPLKYLGWPAFTPDARAIVYHAGSDFRFETNHGATADLFWVDVATHSVARLDALDGYKNGVTYLPSKDPDLSFAPTVLPEAVGGYFWVVFTSHRAYGNTLPSRDEHGKLWVAAFDLDAKPGTDPSHPAFYLDGQESTADNLRGFWVLDPCKSNGSVCTSGDECCAGFCRKADGGGFQCSPKPDGCSQEFEKCVTAAACCDVGFQCLNGKCAQPAPPQ